MDTNPLVPTNMQGAAVPHRLAMGLPPSVPVSLGSAVVAPSRSLRSLAHSQKAGPPGEGSVSLASLRSIQSDAPSRFQNSRHMRPTMLGSSMRLSASDAALVALSAPPRQGGSPPGRPRHEIQSLATSQSLQRRRCPTWPSQQKGSFATAHASIHSLCAARSARLGGAFPLACPRAERSGSRRSSGSRRNGARPPNAHCARSRSTVALIPHGSHLRWSPARHHSCSRTCRRASRLEHARTSTPFCFLRDERQCSQSVRSTSRSWRPRGNGLFVDERQKRRIRTRVRDGTFLAPPHNVGHMIVDHGIRHAHK